MIFGPSADPEYPWDVQAQWQFESSRISRRGMGHGGDFLDAVLNALWDAKTVLDALQETHALRWVGGPGLALPIGLVEYPPAQ